MKVQNFRRVLKLFVSLLSPKYSQGDCCREWFSARDSMVVWDTLELLQTTLHKFLWPCKSSYFASLFHGHEWKGYAENFSRWKIPKNAVLPSDPQSLGTQWSVVLRILEWGMGSLLPSTSLHTHTSSHITTSFPKTRSKGPEESSPVSSHSTRGWGWEPGGQRFDSKSHMMGYSGGGGWAMELFYILIVVVGTGLYAFIKTQKSIHQKEWLLLCANKLINFK